MVDPRGDNGASTLRGALIGICVGYMISLFFGGSHVSTVADRHGPSSRAMRLLIDEDDEQSSALPSSDPDFFTPHNEEAEELEHEISERAVSSTSIMCIVLLLITLTIGFEYAKEHMEEAASRNMKPILESLFGEMTILGFLSAFTFVATKAGIFQTISLFLFGEEEQEFLVEIFEHVHFTLFFIMVFFVIQVLVLVKEGMETEVEWLEMNRACQDPDYMKALRLNKMDRSTGAVNESFRGRIKRTHSYLSLLPSMRSEKAELQDDHVLFHALRDEFLKERSLETPFTPLEREKCVSNDFNFGRYLSICLAQNLAHVVEVEIVTWIFMGVFTICFYFVNLIVKGNLVTLGWIWAVIGWFVLFAITAFEKHLLSIRKALCVDTPISLPTSPAASIPLPSSQRTSYGTKYQQTGEEKNESDYFSNDEDLERQSDHDDYAIGSDYFVPIHDENSNLMPTIGNMSCSLEDSGRPLPAWCKIDLDAYMSRRPLVSRYFCGNGRPNRQQALFWLEKRGQHLHLLLLQLNLVFTGLYCAIGLRSFIPAIYEECSTLEFVASVVLAAIPLLTMLLNTKHLVATMTEVGTVGTLRRPQVVADVLLEEKTAQAVRAFIVLYKIHRGAEMATKRKHILGEKRDGLHYSYSRSFNKLELAEVSKSFDAFDRSGDGFISLQEFEDILTSLGGKMDPKRVKDMIDMLDNNGDGEISREEFLQWYSDSMEEDDLSPRERAHFLFRMFDADGSGEITIGEFKSTLDALNIGFTVDEIGHLVRELDTDGDGTIGEEEFEHLLMQYNSPGKLDDFYDVHVRTIQGETS